MKLEAGDRIVFIGDSITDASRNREWTDEGDGMIGNGYVRDIAALLAAGYPRMPVRIHNQGISGNTVRDLAARWDTAVVAKKPQWLSVMIGINDVWRQFDKPLATEEHVLPREFEQTLGLLIERTLPSLKGVVLIPPFFVDANMLEPMRQRCEHYAGLVKKIARRFDAVLVDVQKSIDDILQTNQGYMLARDRVHPTAAGHMLLATCWLKAMGYSWS